MQTITQDPTLYDTKEIPVVAFTNNSLGTPDITEASIQLISEAEKLINKIPKEFEKGKIIFAFNNIINSTNTGKDFERKVIANGADTYDLNDPDGAIANSMAPMSNGMRLYWNDRKNIWTSMTLERENLSFQFRDHGEDYKKNMK